MFYVTPEWRKWNLLSDLRNKNPKFDITGFLNGKICCFSLFDVDNLSRFLVSSQFSDVLNSINPTINRENKQHINRNKTLNPEPAIRDVFWNAFAFPASKTIN